jgi:aspartate kinase
VRIVQKYGGSSVGSVERIRRCAERIASARADGHEIVVVVSAMGGETDRLMALANAITELPNQRELDVLLSTGEQVSIALLAMTLETMGVAARSFLGHQVQILTDNAHGRARIQSIQAPRMLRALEEGEVVVLAGFQGTDADGSITTLGRGGSDTSAVAVAAAIGADACEIYTDVDGIYTADPRLVPSARRIERISYQEMLELASAGAKVLQARSVEFAMRYNVPIHVRSSFTEVTGSWVQEEDHTMEEAVVSGIAHTTGDAKIALRSVPDRPGIAAHVFGLLSDAEILIDMIIQNISEQGHTDLSFTVNQSDVPRVLQILEADLANIGAREILSDTEVARVSIVGVGMRTQPGVASRMFSTLANAGINIDMISTSDIKIACVIDSSHLENAIEALHAAFKLDQEPGATP